MRPALPRHGPVGLRTVRPGRRPAGADLLGRPRRHLRVDRGDVRRPRRRRLPRVRHRLGRAQRGGVRRVPGRAHRRPARPSPVGRRQGHRRRRAGDVAPVPAAGRPAARRALHRRAAEDRARLARCAVRAAGARGRDRRPGRLERADAPDAGRPRSRRLGRADGRAGRAAAAARRHGAPRRRRDRDHPVRRPGHRRHDVVRRAPAGPRGRRRLPRAHDPRAARRPGAARPRDHGGASRQRHRHGGATGYQRAAALSVGGGPIAVLRDAAARAEPHPPARRARRVHRGPYADRAGRAADDVQRARPDDRARGQAQHQRVGAVAPLRAVDRRAVGRHRATARPTRSWPRSRRPHPASPAASSRCTCRRRWTSSASWGCAAATSCTSRWAWTRCSPTGRCPSWRATVRRCAACSSPARRPIRAAGCSAPPAGPRRGS